MPGTREAGKDAVLMKFHHATSEIFIPDGKPLAEALGRITHLGIGAHQDDLEFMAFHGIVSCLDSLEKWFGGITCSNGAGSARTGAYAGFSNAQMAAVRRREQTAAAGIGRYGVMIQLDHPSGTVKSPDHVSLKDDLKLILGHMRPEVIYTHNPADKHDTHVGVTVTVLRALRELPPERRPKKVWGCEVWRDLDWLPDADKVRMDVSGYEDLAASLNGVFDSQIAGGKRYDTAVAGRRRANATFDESHDTDKSTQLILGMDLTPLVAEQSLELTGFVEDLIDKFKTDVLSRLRQHPAFQ